jgi:hypothetical protein
MSNFAQKTIVKSLSIGSAVFLALIFATPIMPAAAQGVPAGLLRLDPPQSSNDLTKLPAAEQAKLRSSYARVRKTTPAH